MKFDKIVSLGIPEYYLDSQYWDKIKTLGDRFIMLQKDSNDLKKELADADCILANPFSVDVNKGLLEAAPKLKYIGALSTAYGKVDVDYAASKKILVTNIPGYSTESVAEFVFAALLEYIRELEKGKKQAREGNYSEEGFAATEIKDKNFGVVGLGRIGGRVAELALGFGARTKYWSRNRKPELESKGVVFENLDSLIKDCDILSIHLALTPSTKNFFDKRKIDLIRKGALVINTAPMELIDLVAIEQRLKTGDISFLFDHSDEIDPAEVKKLSGYQNCVVYPPIAYLSKEGRINKQNIFIENMENFLKGTPSNKVN